MDQPKPTIYTQLTREGEPTPEEINQAKLSLVPSVWLWVTSYSDTRSSVGAYATRELAEQAFRDHCAGLIEEEHEVIPSWEETPDPKTATIDDLIAWHDEQYDDTMQEIMEVEIQFTTD
jgi:hypothetical protein